MLQKKELNSIFLKANKPMEENDKIYAWIWNVIKSCKEPSHIEPCEVLIKFYEKKGPDKYLVDNLRKALEVQVFIIQEHYKAQEQITKEEKVWEMYKTGDHTIKQISERLNVKLLKCHEIIDAKLK